MCEIGCETPVSPPPLRPNRADGYRAYLEMLPLEFLVGDGVRILNEVMEEKRRKEREELLANVKSLAEKHGMMVVLQDLKEGRKSGMLPPKFRDPSDHNRTWCGRGNRPNWINRHIAQGGNLAELEIVVGGEDGGS